MHRFVTTHGKKKINSETRQLAYMDGVFYIHQPAVKVVVLC